MFPILSFHISSHLISSHLISSHLISSHLISSHLMCIVSDYHTGGEDYNRLRPLSYPFGAKQSLFFSSLLPFPLFFLYRPSQICLITSRYPQTDVFLLCFSLTSRSSFDEIWDGVSSSFPSFPSFRSLPSSSTTLISPFSLSSSISILLQHLLTTLS